MRLCLKMISRPWFKISAVLTNLFTRKPKSSTTSWWKRIKKGLTWAFSSVKRRLWILSRGSMATRAQLSLKANLNSPIWGGTFKQIRGHKVPKVQTMLTFTKELSIWERKEIGPKPNTKKCLETRKHLSESGILTTAKRRNSFKEIIHMMMLESVSTKRQWRKRKSMLAKSKSKTSRK